MSQIQISMENCKEEELYQLLQMLQENENLHITILCEGVNSQEIETYVTEPYAAGIARVLSEFGIPSNLRGYRYIKTAIELSMKDRDILDSMTKRLYPEVAKRYQVEHGQVEHAIRHAIKKAWRHNNSILQKQLFGNSLEDGERPTNAAFIAAVADYLELTTH